MQSKKNPEFKDLEVGNTVYSISEIGVTPLLIKDIEKGQVYSSKFTLEKPYIQATHRDIELYLESTHDKGIVSCLRELIEYRDLINKEVNEIVREELGLWNQ